MSEETKQRFDEPIAGHEYDGIQELNNPLPRWWLATFYGTIIFGLLYWGYFELGPGPSQDERLARRMEKIHTASASAAEAAASSEADVDVAAMMADPEVLAVGKARFEATCSVCHGMAGEGTIGPNLTDDYWIHSKGDLAAILQSFRQGFPEKGMPPWDALIPREEHVPLAIYVMSLRGTNPPNPKDPQGELVEE